MHSKKVFFIVLLLSFSFLTFAQKANKKNSQSRNNTTSEAASKEGYSITITVKGNEFKKFYLGYYYGNNQYLRDSAVTDNKGKMTFLGDKNLEGGVYLIATEDKSLLFDFIVTEQRFTLETDTNGLIDSMKVKGSLENEIFFRYNKTASKIGRKAYEVEQNIKAAREAKNKADEDAYLANYKELMTELNNERLKIIQDYPNLLMSKVFRMMQEVEVPDPPKNEKGEIIDSNFQYQYYKQHYFDNFDFSDSRITRTPVFFPKFESYMLKVVPQIPDTIIVDADRVIKLAEKSDENFKFCLFWITNHYEASQYMGMDAVFVHLIDKYYATGKAYWVDSLIVWKMKDKCDKLRNNLLGVKGKNLTMLDTNGKYHSLYNLDSKYTLLIFWNATCGHCKEEMPKVVEAYKDLNKNVKPKAPLFFDVYSVSLTENLDDLKKYMIEQKLPWKLNVFDGLNETNFRQYYDVYSTPIIYILDKDKKVIAKKIAANQIKEFIENAEKIEKLKNEKK
jgi:thiol-disulfide isomerase/thioredoxin